MCRVRWRGDDDDDFTEREAATAEARRQANAPIVAANKACTARANALLAEGQALEARADYPGAIAKYEAVRAEGRKIANMRKAQQV